MTPAEVLELARKHGYVFPEGIEAKYVRFPRWIIHESSLSALIAEVEARTLERAAAAVEDRERIGREWVPQSLWDVLSREATARIRALKPGQGAA